MKCLVIGSGAREHAIVNALTRAKTSVEVYCFGGHINPGIHTQCADYHVGDMLSPQQVTEYAKKQKVEFAIVGPEAPLAAGVADALWAVNIPVVGPKQQLANIETSKSFARDLLTKYGIPGCPQYKTFDSMQDVEAFLQTLGDDYVIKADGLMGGKGVKVSGDHLHSHDEALVYCQSLLDKKQRFVIEEKCIGQEFSLLSFTDGQAVVHMPIVQDHKRAFVGDRGPNTGGMGSYSCADHSLPFINEHDVNAAKAMNEATIKCMRDEYDENYIGILYGGYMATKDGVKLIEYNCRFGDPEAMNVLALLESDFVSLCQAMVNGRLSDESVTFSQKATVCKYVVPEGYPDEPVKQRAIQVPKEVLPRCYFASVDENLMLLGSRAVAVLGVGETLEEAERASQEAVSAIHGPVFYREDIGTQALIDTRIKHMAKIRQEETVNT
ncbi:MAG: phosphoribosylamine--glycine ligase [Gammaproteobacteria bacterium]